MEVKIYRVYNERLITDREDKSQINSPLLQILNKLQRKINKESSIRHASSAGNMEDDISRHRRDDY